MKNKQGNFIVIDGPDGAGKTTQIRLLSEHLRKKGVDVLALRDPGGTRIGDRIREILLDNKFTEMSIRCETLLYMASRAQLYSEKIKPALQNNKYVICDRWVSSTYAYQAVAGETGSEMVLRLAEAALERAWPDITVIIDVPSEIGLKRVGNNPDRMENKPPEFHRKVRQAFLDMAGRRNDFYVINGSNSISTVQNELRDIVRKYVNS